MTKVKQLKYFKVIFGAKLRDIYILTRAIAFFSSNIKKL